MSTNSAQYFWIILVMTLFIYYMLRKNSDQGEFTDKLYKECSKLKRVSINIDTIYFLATQSIDAYNFRLLHFSK